MTPCDQRHATRGYSRVINLAVFRRMTVSTQGSIHDVLVLPYLNHAIRMLESGYATATDIDNAMRFGCGYPKGPLATVDEIGASSVRDALLARFEETGDNLHKPADLLTKTSDEAGSFTGAAGDDVRTPELRHTIEKIGVVGTGTMASPRRGTTSASSAAPRRSSTGSSPASPSRSTRPSRRAARTRRPRPRCSAA